MDNGLYHAFAPDYTPVMVDPSFEGFRIVYHRETPIRAERSCGVITDGIELKSMADGKIYTSKARYYESLKAADSHIIEAGEHKPDAQKLRGDFGCRKELKQAIHQHLGR
jgi:hypothetical protein